MPFQVHEHTFLWGNNIQVWSVTRFTQLHALIKKLPPKSPQKELPQQILTGKIRNLQAIKKTDTGKS